MLTRALSVSLIAAATASGDITFFGPVVFPGNATDKIGGENRGDDDGGVARIGEVVHRPTEHFALANAGLQG